MSETVKHTPGPWQWDAGMIPPDGPGYYADIYVDGGETTIASFNDSIPEGRANARLIAAAPDLLAAAKTVLDGLNARIDAADQRSVPVFDGIADLYAALAKAEGTP